jgi:hypothetical protein
MKKTTIVVARDGSVYDLGKTKTEEILIPKKDGTVKLARLIRPTEYPPTLRCPQNGVIQNPEDIPAFATSCTQDYCDFLKRMSKREVRKHFRLK